MNAFGYVGGNPIRFIDPHGEFAVMPLIYIGITAYGLYEGYKAWIKSAEAMDARVNMIENAVLMQNDHRITNIEELQAESFNKTIDAAQQLNDLSTAIEGGKLIKDIGGAVKACQK